MGSGAWGAPWEDIRTAGVVVAVLAAVVYLNTLANGFAYDDVYIIEFNRAIQSWGTLPDALRAPYWPTTTGRELGLWRPVATAVYGVQHVVGGGAPMLFHATNVLMHVLASILTLALLSALLTLPAAFVGGVVFAVHPVHVEAVANVVGFAELGSTVAILAGCLIHLRSGARTRWRAALAVGLCYLVGFGTKEGAVVLPGLVFLIDSARGRIAFSDLPAYLADRWRLYLTLLVVAVGMMAARHAVLGSFASAYPPLGADILQEAPRIWTLGEIWLHYVRLWIFPLDLASDYSPGLLDIRTSWGVENTVGALLAIAILGLSLVLWRRSPLDPASDSARVAAFGVVWFTIAISPVSNTLFLSGILLAERTFYLPSVGLAAATGWLVMRGFRARPQLVGATAVLFVVFCCARTWTRNATWKDNPTVFTTLMVEHPQSGRSQWYLGDQHMAAGRTDAALRSYSAAVDLLGSDYNMVTQIATRLLEAGMVRSAEGLLRHAISDQPGFRYGHAVLAGIRAEHGDAIETEKASRAALATRGADRIRLHLLAWSLAAQGRMDEAREARASADRVGPVGLWQRHLYDAYASRASDDGPGVALALDSAWATVATDVGRAALDSVMVSDFGLPSRRTMVGEPGEGGR